MSESRPPISDLMEKIGATDLGEDPSPEAEEALLHRWVGSLQGTDLLRVETERKTLVERTALSARQIDAALNSLRSGSPREDKLQGSAVEFDDPKPWPSDVEGQKLLSELAGTFERFLALPEGAATAFSLWVGHAHAHGAAEVSPVLAITSPTKRCGKTTALEVLGALVPRPLPASNITPASLFRAVEQFSPSLLIDEADTFLKRGDDLRGVLNSGHSRRSAFIVRTVGEEHEPRQFKTWAPKAVALIGDLPDTLADRSIEVRMRRRSPEETVERLRRDRLDRLQALRRRAWSWARDRENKLRSADPDLPSELGDRSRDNWRPLVAIADEAGGVWPDRARATAVEISSGESDESNSYREQLLRDIRDIFRERDTDRIRSKELCRILRTREDRPWPDWGRRDQGLSPVSLAHQLKAFDVRPKTIRFGSGNTAKGYRRAMFEEPWRRYVSERGRNSRNKAATSRTNGDCEGVTSDGDVTSSGASVDGGVPGDVTDVTASSPAPRDEKDRDAVRPLTADGKDGLELGVCRDCGRSLGPSATICGSCRRKERG